MFDDVTGQQLGGTFRKQKHIHQMFKTGPDFIAVNDSEVSCIMVKILK